MQNSNRSEKGQNVNNTYLRIGSGALAISLAAALFVGVQGFGNGALFGPPWDKLAHFLYYGTIAGLFAHALGPQWHWGALLGAAFLGALDEWNQFYTPGRESSFFDWLADVLGALAALYLYRRWLLRGDSGGSAPSSRTIPPASA